MTATLEDNPVGAGLCFDAAAQISRSRTTGTTKRSAYLPRKLTEEGSGPFNNERPGDLCYFAPWGNLAFFYAGYRWSQGLIRLGRIDGGFDPLLVRGEFPLRIEPVS